MITAPHLQLNTSGRTPIGRGKLLSCDPRICLVIRLQLAADSQPMRYGLLVGAFVVVALLMTIGMRQRWILGPRGRWESGARGRWEPGTAGQWEPRRGLGEPPPRMQWQLAVIGWCLLLSGMLLALLLRNQVIGFIAVTGYAATWIARIILLDWSQATGPLLRVTAIARPLAFAGGIVLAVMTRSILVAHWRCGPIRSHPNGDRVDSVMAQPRGPRAIHLPGRR